MKKTMFILLLALQISCNDSPKTTHVKKEHCVVITFKAGFKDTVVYKSFFDGLRLVSNHPGELYDSGCDEIIASGVATFKQLY